MKVFVANRGLGRGYDVGLSLEDPCGWILCTGFFEDPDTAQRVADDIKQIINEAIEKGEKLT